MFRLVLCQIETLSNDMASERTRANALDHLEVLLRNHRVPEVLVGAVARYAFGVLFIKYSLLWPAATRVIVTLSEYGYDDSLWRPFAVQLHRACEYRPTVAAITDTQSDGSSKRRSHEDAPEDEPEDTSVLEQQVVPVGVAALAALYQVRTPHRPCSNTGCVCVCVFVCACVCVRACVCVCL
jgi:hypothetical protein